MALLAIGERAGLGQGRRGRGNLPRGVQRMLGGDAGGKVLTAGRLMLHAATLGFEHPITGERVALSSELPPDFRVTLLDPGRLQAALAGPVSWDRPGDDVLDEDLRLLAIPVARPGACAPPARLRARRRRASG